MQNGEEMAAAAVFAPTLPEEITKQAIRLKVWQHLKINGIAKFPSPTVGRIPNFRGAEEAAARLAELDVFKRAKSVKVNHDSPQSPVKDICLENQKKLYVPVLFTQNGFLTRVVPSTEDVSSPYTKLLGVTRRGMVYYGHTLCMSEQVSLDIVVMGSVAVSKEGYRIGKGKGQEDLEFALMMQKGAIKTNTLVITTVHDCQVFDTLPAELFGPHDVPIDIIVTPTRVIETHCTSQRPVGVMWHMLTSRQVYRMPALKLLWNAERLAGHLCTLKKMDYDLEQRGEARARRETRPHNNHSAGEYEGKEDNPEAGPSARPDSHFCIKISNIRPTIGETDLKEALSKCGFRPRTIVCKAGSGCCYLEFDKSPQEDGGYQGRGATLESVMSALCRSISDINSGLEYAILGDAPNGAEGYACDDDHRFLLVEPVPVDMKEVNYPQNQGN